MTHDSRLIFVRLPARFRLQGEQEGLCSIETVEGNEARLVAATVKRFKEARPIVVYVDLIGRMEGHAVWLSPSELNVSLRGSATKLNRLQRQFRLVAEIPLQNRSELREHRRIQLENPIVKVLLSSGECFHTQVIDISRSGASIRSTSLPREGDLIMIGAMRCRVIRLFEEGFAVHFLRLIPFEIFGTSYDFQHCKVIS